MHRRLAIALVSCVSLALSTGSCSLLIDADRFSDEQSDGGTGVIDGNTDGRGSDAVNTGSACDGRDPLLFSRDRFLLSSGSLILDQPGTYVLDTDNAGRLLDPAGQQIDGLTMLIQTSPGDNSEFLLVVVDDLYLSPATTLRAIGSRPLHLAAAGVMDLHGTIDVSSNADGAGAGADMASECLASGQGASGAGGEGGGGGGFQGRGGDGGVRTLLAAAIGGAESSEDLSTVLRGGCHGGDSSGVGGSGGGAVMLLACEAVTFDARIAAYGQGGRGASGGIVGGGGGGGGSGGFVGIDTPVLTVPNGAFEERIELGGGGGGGGSGSVASPGDGSDGADGLTGAPGVPGGNGGAGGAGGQMIDPRGATGDDGGIGGGGGGGGGGAGYLLDLSGPRP